MARPLNERMDTIEAFEAELRRLGVAEDKIAWLISRRIAPKDETFGHSMLLVTRNRCVEYLYLVRCVGSDYYKIGISTLTPVNRLCQLQVGCPYKLEMCHVFADPSAYQLEQQIHLELKHCHVRGEWYELKPLEVQALIRDIANRIGAEEPIMRRVA